MSRIDTHPPGGTKNQAWSHRFNFWFRAVRSFAARVQLVALWEVKSHSCHVENCERNKNLAFHPWLLRESSAQFLSAPLSTHSPLSTLISHRIKVIRTYDTIRTPFTSSQVSTTLRRNQSVFRQDVHHRNHQRKDVSFQQAQKKIFAPK